ncbi:MAG: SIMPL domain-containing protein [Fusobacterium sp.]
MKKIITGLMLIFSILTFADNNPLIRTLKVTGSANILVPVDTITIHITNSDTQKTYENSLNSSKTALIEFKKQLHLNGFNKKDLKTVNFNINTDYENYKDNNGNYKKRFLGYKYYHSMKLSFKLNDSKLTQVLTSLNTIKGNTEFYLDYKIEDTEKFKNELLIKAIENTKNKAKILANTSGVTLERISNIDYSFNETNNFISPFRGENKILGAKMSSDSLLTINPEDLKFKDTVTITWEIK